MSWILHLSDPHLGDVSPGQEITDEKVRIDRQRDLQTTQRVFKQTLESLRPYVNQNGRPSAAIVSGDVTFQARDEGFEAFSGLLDDFADIWPEDRGRIVVVPGNHDVVWDEDPGSRARYAPFLAATRERECATPLLDGVDFESAEPVTLKAEALDSPHLVDDEDFLVVPINSSNYCGSIVDIENGWSQPEWEAALDPLADGKDEALSQLKKLRQHDIARVSSFQIQALRRLFQQKGVSLPRGADERVRIAVLHHQLLPVSTLEELKTFEAISNLGFVRETLREFGFDCVVHGHKHTSGLYWDFIRGDEEVVTDSPQRLLVVASPGHFRAGAPVMRAITLAGEARARNVRVTTFNGVESFQGESPIGDEQVLPLWLAQMEKEPHDRVVLQGRTAHLVYSRLRALFELRHNKPLRNLVCEIETPEKALELPADYGDTSTEDGQAWFEDFVNWWQRPRSRLVAERVLEFNHGSRIYDRWDDQVERAARALNEQSKSSRALVVLVSPKETGRYPDDRRPADEGTYPAFTLAEFSLVERDGRYRLDCFGYFRKQEMQFWWPANVAELSLLQAAVLKRLESKYRALPGRLVTFSAIALYLDELPRVAVPELDRAVDDDDRLWHMGAAIAFPKNPEASTSRREWYRILAELQGKGRKLPPLPKLGHKHLLGHVQRFATLAPDQSAQAAAGVAEALNHLASLYNGFVTSGINEENQPVVKAAVEKLRAAVEAALGPPD